MNMGGQPGKFFKIKVIKEDLPYHTQKGIVEL